MNDSVNYAYKFERIVKKIFELNGFKVKVPFEDRFSREKSMPFDLIAEYNNSEYCIEIKFSKKSEYPSSLLYSTAEKVCEYAKCQGGKIIPIIVIGAQVNKNALAKVEKVYRRLIVLDIGNLLFLVQNDESLKMELLSFLDFTAKEIYPEEPNRDILASIPKSSKSSKNHLEGEKLKQRVLSWTNDKGYKEYEHLCVNVLKYLFNDELSLWETQNRTESDLYIYDLICKIKDGDVSGLWTTIYQSLNSKYIIFEFKNYSGKITQKEIYTTEKYLYLKALRSVAIIVSCNGASPNAMKAIKGALRENGKLILSINNEDLVKMIDMKMQSDVPADYLYSIFDDMMINLEK